MTIERIVIPELTDKEKKRFWDKVEIGDDSSCWPWIAGLDGKYGILRIRNKNIRSNRIVLFLTTGRQEECARHKCDNPICCNPKHLEWGTQQENMDDMFARNRDRRGDYYTNPGKGIHNGRSKLTNEDVLYIREAYSIGITQTELANKYNMNQGTISAIVHRVTWKHI